ncbi:hypothetical protein KKF61_04055 [Patescibacteria group bacterium]|nr:hypothetical protein [Patescibacteria group bacterium]MBU0963988.1 hypothetical protein [Patescibacteria group bacterium]
MKNFQQTQLTTKTLLGVKISLVIGFLSVISLAAVLVFSLLPKKGSDINLMTKYECPLVVTQDDYWQDYDTKLKTDISESVVLDVLSDNIAADIGDNKKHLLNLRKEVVIELMKNDPEIALEQILGKDNRNIIEQTTKNCVEKIITVEGKIEIIEADDFENKVSYSSYYLKTAEGSYYELHFADVTPNNLISGSSVAVSGYNLDNHILVNGNNIIDVAGSKEEESGYNIKGVREGETLAGTQKTVVLLVKFQDMEEPDLSIEDVNSVMNDVNNFYIENSFGQIDFSGVISPEEPADIFGWYTIPLDSMCVRESSNYNTFFEELLSVTDNDVDFSQYSKLVIISDIFGCGGIAGFASMGSIEVDTPDGVIQIGRSFIDYYYATTKVIGHEIGHNFNLHHANLIECDGGPINKDEYCVVGEYWDAYDIMGSWTAFHLNTLHKEQLGWLSEADIQTASEAGQYIINPYEDAASSVKALKIARTPGEYLYAEYRQPIGYDMSTNEAVIQGCYCGPLMHLEDKSQYGATILLDGQPDYILLRYCFEVGKQLFDPASGRTITVVSKDETQLVLDVTNGKTDFIGPEVSITSPATGVALSGDIEVNAIASDDSGIEKVEFFIAGEENPFALDSEAPYTATLDTINIPNGDLSLLARAYDLSGQELGAWNNSADSESVTVTLSNNDMVNPTISILEPSSGQMLDNPIIIRAAASDNVGIWKVVFTTPSIESSTTIFSPGPYTITKNLYLGNQNINVKAYDYAGNYSSDTVNVIVGDDPPFVSIISPSSYITVMGEIEVEIDAQDPESGIDFVNGFFYTGHYLHLGFDFEAPYVFTANTADYPDGPIKIGAMAKNGSNLYSYSSNIPVTIDNTPPGITFLQPPNGSEVSGIFDINVYASDNSGVERVEFYVSGQTDSLVVDYNYPYHVQINTNDYPADQPIVIFAKAYDLAGEDLGIEGNMGRSQNLVLNPTCGDVDISGSVNISDVLYLLGYIFGNNPEPPAPETCDVDNSGFINLSDAVFLINYIFGGGAEPSCPEAGMRISLSDDPTEGWTQDQVEAYLQEQQSL